MGYLLGVKSVLWLKVELEGPTCQDGWPAGGWAPKFCGRTLFGHWIPHAPTFLDTLAKQNLKRCQHLASRLAPLWLSWARTLCHIIPLCHILCDYALFWTY
jgi:hypothetical protein